LVTKIRTSRNSATLADRVKPLFLLRKYFWHEFAKNKPALIIKFLSGDV